MEISFMYNKNKWRIFTICKSKCRGDSKGSDRRSTRKWGFSDEILTREWVMKEEDANRKKREKEGEDKEIRG